MKSSNIGIFSVFVLLFQISVEVATQEAAVTNAPAVISNTYPASNNTSSTTTETSFATIQTSSETILMDELFQDELFQDEKESSDELEILLRDTLAVSKREVKPRERPIHVSSKNELRGRPRYTTARPRHNTPHAGRTPSRSNPKTRGGKTIKPAALPNSHLTLRPQTTRTTKRGTPRPTKLPAQRGRTTKRTTVRSKTTLSTKRYTPNATHQALPTKPKTKSNGKKVFLTPENWPKTRPKYWPKHMPTNWPKSWPNLWSAKWPETLPEILLKNWPTFFSRSNEQIEKENWSGNEIDSKEDSVYKWHGVVPENGGDTWTEPDTENLPETITESGIESGSENWTENGQESVPDSSTDVGTGDLDWTEGPTEEWTEGPTEEWTEEPTEQWTEGPTEEWTEQPEDDSAESGLENEPVNWTEHNSGGFLNRLLKFCLNRWQKYFPLTESWLTNQTSAWLQNLFKSRIEPSL